MRFFSTKFNSAFLKVSYRPSPSKNYGFYDWKACLDSLYSLNYVFILSLFLPVGF
ncbi:unknown protein [Microcystis aeruginosa NIES-843]|uniref:Uncharacterized protein n=1 Tax=Microcystis aeruginosa (strain NIES-843 / IAM M-2473) TaxID=449447 RepID=B0JIR3_MICAN|nr:unknown protein [Microcystis aeruginosa NIES-843]